MEVLTVNQDLMGEEKMAKAKVKIEIDGKELSVLEGTTILKAAQDAGDQHSDPLPQAGSDA